MFAASERADDTTTRNMDVSYETSRASNYLALIGRRLSVCEGRYRDKSCLEAKTSVDLSRETFSIKHFTISGQIASESIGTELLS
jgi:hypothetical protein